MKRALQGCGCALGALVGAAATIAASVALLLGLAGWLGWPAAIGLVLLAMGGFAAIVWLLVRGVGNAVARMRAAAPYAPYRSRIGEIDGLLADARARITKIAGEDTGVDLLGKLAEIDSRKKAILEGIVELDAFLRAPGNGETRLQIEAATLSMRARLATGSVQETLQVSRRKLLGVAEAVRKVKADREALLVNLEGIAIALKEVRARLATPSATPDSVSRELAEEVASLARAMDRLETAKAEVEEAERSGPRPVARPTSTTS